MPSRFRSKHCPTAPTPRPTLLSTRIRRQAWKTCHCRLQALLLSSYCRLLLIMKVNRLWSWTPLRLATLSSPTIYGECQTKSNFVTFKQSGHLATEPLRMLKSTPQTAPDEWIAYLTPLSLSFSTRFWAETCIKDLQWPRPNPSINCQNNLRSREGETIRIKAWKSSLMKAKEWCWTSSHRPTFHLSKGQDLCSPW